MKAITKQLLDAVSEGSQTKVESCLQNGASLNDKDDDGCDAGLRAAINGNIEMYDYLSTLEGFNKNSVDRFGNDAAILATAFNKVEMYDHLISHHGFDIKAVNNFGYDAITLGIHGNIEVDTVKHLIKNYPINLKLPLKTAEQNGKNEIASAIDDHITLERNIFNAFTDIEKFKELCEQGAQPKRFSDEFGRILKWVAARGDAEVYDYIVKNYGEKVDYQDLLVAAKNHEIKMVKYLLDEQGKNFTGMALEQARAIFHNDEEVSNIIAEARKKRVNVEEISDCISPHDSKAQWRPLEDPTIYYSFDVPIFNPYITALKEQERDFFRKVVTQNSHKLNIPIQEIKLKPEERGIPYLISESPLNIITVGVSARNYLTPPTLGAVTNFPKNAKSENDIVHKKVVLMQDALNPNQPNRATYVILHEFFGHAVGNLKHPNKYSDSEPGPFCKDDIFTEESLMSYYSGDFIHCVARKESVKDKTNCDEKYPTELRLADMMAIQKEGKRINNKAGTRNNNLIELMFANPLMTQDDISIFEKFESTIQSGISDFQESAKPLDQKSPITTNSTNMLSYPIAALAGVLLLYIAKRFSNEKPQNKIKATENIKVTDNNDEKFH